MLLLSNTEAMENLLLIFAGGAAMVTAILNLDSLYGGTRSRKKQAQVDLLGKGGVRAMVFLGGLLAFIVGIVEMF